MRKLLFILTFAGIFLLFPGCEDALDFDFKAIFNSNLSIDIEETKTDAYAFSATDTLNIEDDEDIQTHIDKLKEMEITKVECTLTGIPEGAVIQQLSVQVEEAGFFISLTDLTENHKFEMEVTDAMLDLLADYLLENHQSVITVFGTSSYAPMTLGVKLTWHTNITAGL